MSTVIASHILVETLEEAQSIKSKLSEGADFSVLAKSLSKCPSAEVGGSLGQFGRGVMVPEFEAVAFMTPVGGFSDPVKTQFGYHVIQRLA